MSTDSLDDLLPLTTAAKLLPKNSQGKSPSIQTLRRWSKRGSRGVLLETTFVGGRAYLSRRAIVDFIARRNAITPSIVNPSPGIGAARAVEKLRRMGA